MSGTRLSPNAITVTAPDPRALADFYARLLGAEVAVSDPPREHEPDAAGWAQVRTGGLTLNFEYERHWQAPVWPAEPGRPHATQHLDIHVDDLDVAVAHAVEQGARLADFQPQEDVRVLFDPAGHPFCLFL
ncbi:VOC family protein [Glycomyces terrestris]|uniref:VOC family protein n=1 Tax=Glycomyces terrestris TaxID=2493553 RepID=A0A426UXT2_9ACTN|nr:VOC family protein [Glycomyces terrestris]RRR99369.1 VOC family protein [Glycomyces terrestris]